MTATKRRIALDIVATDTHCGYGWGQCEHLDQGYQRCAAFPSERAARRAWVYHHNRMRAYWAAKCRCWHTTKEVMTDEARSSRHTTKAHRRS